MDSDGATTASNLKPPQISDMFQKFALAFKAKTFDFFSEEEEAAAVVDDDGFTLFNSAEDFIPDQKVIILKPDPPVPEEETPSAADTHHLPQQSANPNSIVSTRIRPLDSQLAHSLIFSIFATVSSFEASYLQLQTAHVPFSEQGIKTADEAIVSNLQRLSDFKHFYMGFSGNSELAFGLPIGSCLEAQVQENQSKLRVLGTVSDRLQAEIDRKDSEVSAMRMNLGDLHKSNVLLSKRLAVNLNLNTSADVLLSVRVFESLLNDTRRALHQFTKILIDLMRKASWDLDLAANSVHPCIEYAKGGHNGYAFLSYVCIGMFRGFDSKNFSLEGNEADNLCNVHGSDSVKVNSSLKQLLQHVSSSAMEMLSRNPTSQFSRFCEKKYQELIHPTMESSIFCNLDPNNAVVNSWRSLSTFYESFVNMASSVWTLHKLAFSFDPAVEIFQVEKGVDFSMVFMEDVTRKFTLPTKTRRKVGFTVFPGFKVGRTVIQSQVYLNGWKCT
ncbi:Protein GRAVITROPIC IN THE LIGHT 1 [Linum perenne]